MDKIKTYYESRRISNSLLTRVANPKLFQKLKDVSEETPALRIGSALDCLLTDPDRWDSEFIVLDIEQPTGKIGKFVSSLPPGITKQSPLEDFQAAYEIADYNRSLEWVVDFFWKTPEAHSYYNSKQISEGKKLLSVSEYLGVMKAKESIMENDFTSRYFFPQFVQHELLHQTPIYFNYENVECKALLDGILIDHKEQTIQPFDLKTTGKSVYEFRESFLFFGYYRQAAFYEVALKTPESPISSYLKRGYKLNDFIFIVVESSKDSLNPAIIYQTTPFDRYCGLYGGVINKKTYKGVNRLIEEYLFYSENNLWDLPKDLLESQGRLVLDVFN